MSKTDESLKEYLKLKNINFLNEDSHSFMQWQHSLTSLSLKNRNVKYFINKLLNTNSFLLYKVCSKRLSLFNEKISLLKSIPGNEYLVRLILNDFKINFKSETLKKYKAYSHLIRVLNDIAQNFLKENTKPSIWAIKEN